MIDCLLVWLHVWSFFLVEWLFGCVFVLLVVRSVDSVVGGLVACLLDCLMFDCLIAWPFDCVIDWLVGWLRERLLDCMIGLLRVCLAV